jgi:hypothetical protein
MDNVTVRRALYVLVLSLTCLPVFGETWYVRPDGGTRFTPGRVSAGLSAQCDGRHDAPYPGSGKNQPCAFNDVRFLWGEATYGKNLSWVGKGGDTYIIRGSIGAGVTWRIGWPNASTGLDQKSGNYWGIPGDPYGSGMPVPPSGTTSQHTRILGENYASCHTPAARTQLHGGYGVGSVLRMNGASYVDLACLDITDFSSCGRSGQAHACNTNPGTLDDYASSGISWSNASTHDTLTDVSVHGTAGSGMVGPTGDGTVFSYLSIIGNAAAGWNADAGDGTTGTGSLHVDNFNISWNGCSEQYPIVNALPYQDCTDDNAGGYGDGFGTATIPSNPGWVVVFDHGIASYNTQDGLDALHLIGAGSSMTVSQTVAFGNMGQQIKVGGSQGILRHNIVYSNCNALRENIPGTPSGYNSHLSDFCRAADTGVFITVNDGSTTIYEDNTMYSASATGLQVGVYTSCTTPTCRIQQRRNIFLGFPKNKADGYPTQDTGEYPNPVYTEGASMAYTNPGSSFDGNITYHARSNWPCPNRHLHETNAKCGDPHLADETWHVYGYGDTTPTSHGNTDTSQDNQQNADPATGTHPTASSKLKLFVIPAILLVSLWTGIRYFPKNSADSTNN